MSPAPTKTHQALNVPCLAAELALHHIRKFARIAELHHHLPGAVIDLITASQQLLDIAAQIDPDILHAIELGKRSTFGLPRCAEALAQEIVQAARIGGGL